MDRGIVNFFKLYQPIADRWRFYDSTDFAGPRLLAGGAGKFVDTVADPMLWERITRMGEGYHE